MTISTIALVEVFQRGIKEVVLARPGFPDQRTLLLRLHLLQEELGELAGAMAAGNMVECLDALSDLQYVLDGCYLALGLQDVKDHAFVEVHRSNMTKFVDGKAVLNDFGRVVKGPGYEPPRLQRLLETYIDDKRLADKRAAGAV